MSQSRLELDVRTVPVFLIFHRCQKSYLRKCAVMLSGSAAADESKDLRLPSPVHGANSEAPH
jgi:hypothetical protein